MLWAPGPAWYLGIAQSIEIPPPPAPSGKSACGLRCSSQTDSVGLGPSRGEVGPADPGDERLRARVPGVEQERGDDERAVCRSRR